MNSQKRANKIIKKAGGVRIKRGPNKGKWDMTKAVKKEGKKRK